MKDRLPSAVRKVTFFNDSGQPINGVVEISELYRACESCDYLTAAEDLDAVENPDSKDGYKEAAWLCPACTKKLKSEPLNYTLSAVLNSMTTHHGKR